MPKGISAKKGFTLVEAVLVVSILSVVGIALFHAFSDGMKIWKRTRTFNAGEDIAIFFDKIEVDLKNAFSYPGLSFRGREEYVHFSTRIKLPDPDGGGIGEQIGEVEYAFDPAQNTIVRKEAVYGRALENSFSRQRVLAAAIHSLRFSYYYAQEGTPQFKDSADQFLPAAVKVEVELLDEQGTRVLKKFINVPMGT